MPNSRPTRRRQSLRPLLALIALVLLFTSPTGARAQSLSIPIPEHPATVVFGPLTIPYPEDWEKKEAKIGEGINLFNPQPITVAGKSLSLLIGIGKRSNHGKNLLEYKAGLDAMMMLQIKALNDAIQKQVAAAGADKGVSVQLAEMGKWSLDVEKHDGVDILHSSFIGVNDIDGQKVSFHTQGLWHVTPAGVFNIIFTYPTVMEPDCGPFVDWLFKHITLAR